MAKKKTKPGEYRRDKIKREKKPIKHGKKLANRRELVGTSGRFFVEADRKIIHDLVKENQHCKLNKAMKSGEGEIYHKSLEEAKAEGYAPCEECMEGNLNNAFDGTNTVLLLVHTPYRKQGEAVDGVVEREEFNLSLIRAVMPLSNEQQSSIGVLSTLGARTIQYQAIRRDKKDLAPALWGTPDNVLSFNPDHDATVTTEDDVMVDVIFPTALCPDPSQISAMTKKFTDDLFKFTSARKVIRNHVRRYGYRDMALFGHVTESVDEFILHRVHPKCSISGGSWGFSAGFSAGTGSATVDCGTGYSAGVTVSGGGFGTTSTINGDKSGGGVGC